MPKFFPPTIAEGPAGFGLFYRYKLDRGISVLKIGSKYYKLRVPSKLQVSVHDLINLCFVGTPGFKNIA